MKKLSLILIFCLIATNVFAEYISETPSAYQYFPITDDRYVNKTGDTMSGDLTVNANITAIDITATGSVSGSTVTGNTIYYTDLYDSDGVEIDDKIENALGGLNFDYFLNDTDSDIGGYETMETALTGEAESSWSITVTTDGTAIEEFATISTEPTFTILTSGIYEFHFHALVDSTAGDYNTAKLYYELYKRDTGGTETLLMTSEESDTLTTIKASLSIHASLADEEILALTDRLVLKAIGNLEIEGRANDPQVTLYAEGTNNTRLSVKTTTEAQDDRYVNETGDTMRGDLSMGMYDLVRVGEITANTITTNTVRVGLSKIGEEGFTGTTVSGNTITGTTVTGTTVYAPQLWIGGGTNRFTFPQDAPTDDYILKYDVNLARLAWEADADTGGAGAVGFVGWTQDNNDPNYTLSPVTGNTVSANTIIATHITANSVTTNTIEIFGRDDVVQFLLQEAPDQTANIFVVQKFDGTDLFDIESSGEVDIIHTADENDDRTLEIDTNAAGFGDVKAVDIVYTTGAISAGEDEAVILVNIDESASGGGDIFGLEVLTTAEGEATVNALKAGAQVAPMLQESGTFGDMDSALVLAINRRSEFISTGSNIVMFVADDDTITIGDAEQFTELEFILATTSSNPGIKPTFEFSDGVGSWDTFSPTDGTNGMRNTGIVAWDLADVPSWVKGTGSEYLIRITRTQNNLSTTPIESIVQISATTRYEWDKNGDILIRNLTATQRVSANIVIGNYIYGENIGAEGTVTGNTVSGNTIRSGATLLAEEGLTANVVSGNTVTGITVTASTAFYLPYNENPDAKGIGKLAWDSNDGMLAVSGNSVTGGTVTRLFPHRFIREMQIFAPDSVNDEFEFLYITPLVYPHGIEVVGVGIRLPSDAAYTMPFEIWSGDPPVFEEPIESVTTGAADSEAMVSATSINEVNVDEGKMIYIDIPATDVDWVKVWLVGEVKGGN